MSKSKRPSQGLLRRANQQKQRAADHRAAGRTFEAARCEQLAREYTAAARKLQEEESATYDQAGFRDEDLRGLLGSNYAFGMEC